MSDIVLVREANRKMTDQKCEAVRVLGGATNWEDYYWPQDVRKLDKDVLEMLQTLNLVEYEEVFRKQQLSLTDIRQLNHEALKSIGISLVKHCTAIIQYFSGKYNNQIALENFFFSPIFSQQLSS